MAIKTSDDHTVARRSKHFYPVLRSVCPRGLKSAAQKIWYGIDKLTRYCAIATMLALPIASYGQSSLALPSEQRAENDREVAPQQSHRRASPITRWVPASTKLFIRVRELDKVDASLQRTHAWQLLPLIAGQPIKADHSFPIRDALVKFLGISPSANNKALTQCEIGIVADSWLELPHAVWIVKLPGPNVLDEWFPKETRIGDRKIGLARLFRTRSGLSVCTRGRYVALARRGANQQTLQRIRSLMVSQRSTTKPLSLSKSYRELMTYLPGQDIAHAYFSLSDASSLISGSQASTLTGLEGTAMVGMFDRDNHIDFTFRLSKTSSSQTAILADDTLEKMAKLPSTTIAALATTFDFAGYNDRTMSGPPRSAALRYLQLLQGFGRRNSDQTNLIKSLGPDVLVVWDAGTDQESSQLHLAVMIRCTGAQKIRTEFTYLVANLLRVLQIFEPADSSNEPTLELKRYLGLPYIYVDWSAYAENAKIPTVQQLKHTSPSWTAWGDWFVFALDRDHLERMVDARYGIRETIENSAEVNPLSLQKNKATTAALVRSGLAAQSVQTWLGAAGTTKASLWASSWLMNRQSLETKPTAGFGFSTVADDEAVIVLSVDAQGLAAKLLQVGDRIRGVDGSLLSLNDPVSDLASRLASISNTPHRLRMQRDGQWMEVKLPIRKAVAASAQDNPVDAAISALREFAKLGQTFQETFISIHAPDDHTTAARLTIKLKPLSGETIKEDSSKATIYSK